MHIPDRAGNLAYRNTSSLRTGVEAELGFPVSIREDSPPRNTRLDGRRRKRYQWLAVGTSFASLILVFLFLFGRTRSPSESLLEAGITQAPILVSYSYFEKDEVQRANAEFFLKVGMGIESSFQPPQATDFVIVVQGKVCSPCEKLRSRLEADPLLTEFAATLANAWSGSNLALLWRLENEGMDFAAHNVTMQWVRRKRQMKKYRYFIFLNSSVRGPFVPSYMPRGWQWTRAFTDRLRGDVRAVASSLVCLPPEDAGGYGPKLESWAFALDEEGLRLTTEAGVFWLRTCKLCADERGIVVRGEYGISKVLLDAGHNIATLMSRYGTDVDWRDRANWGCNDNAHPSRHGTYDHISMHPFETVFLKASWHVGQPHLDRYTGWFEAHAQGEPGTSGTFDSAMYRYAISEEAQRPNGAEECFKVL